MSFWVFWRTAVRNAAKKAWHAGHTVHFLIVCAAGACFYAGYHFEETGFIWLPVTVFVIGTILLFLKAAHLMYLEEWTMRHSVQNEILKITTPSLEMSIEDGLTDGVRGTEGDKFYRVIVRNTSSVTLENVRISLESCNPGIPHLPMHLHFTNHNLELTKDISLHPDETRTVDVFRVRCSSGIFCVTGNEVKVEIPANVYVLILTSRSQNTTPVTKTFRIVPFGDAARLIAA